MKNSDSKLKIHQKFLKKIFGAETFHLPVRQAGFKLCIFNFRLRRTGFTLLETIVAIAILSMAMLGPLELASRTIGSAAVSQNQITAFYLAQEGIEYVRNVRDNNFLNGAGWLNGLEDCLGANGCVIDIPNYNPSSPAESSAACGSVCPNIKYDEAGGFFYNYASGESTIFRRTVKITAGVGGNSDEANISSVVYWKGKFAGKSVGVEEDIFNWR